ncbi:MAG TPA: MFS transporter [Candidatus Dormibacteraeota bacterium]|nr:MFS transporter [Candidatus Dormibacteraeota bacterium]
MSSLQAAGRTSGASVIVAVLLATAVAPLNATMIVVALPTIGAEFHASLATSSLLVTGYLVAMAVLPPLGGRLGDRWNRPTLMFTGLALFAGAAFGATAAPSMSVLVACRVAQAVGAALAFPNALALLRELISPRHRGLSFGLVGAGMALAAAAGPPLGQLLLWGGGWRWVFAINLPVVGLAMAAGVGSLRQMADRRQSAISTAVPVRRTIFLRSPRLAAATLAMALSNVALYAALVGIPLLLTAAGAASESALLLTALLAAAALAATLGGRLADVGGRRVAAVMGLCALATGLLPIALAGQRLGVHAMLAGLVMAGAGLGASSTAIQIGGMEAVSVAASGAAAGLLATSRYIGGAAGSSVLPLVMALAPREPLNALFAVAVAAALLAAGAGACLGAGRISLSSSRE